MANVIEVDYYNRCKDKQLVAGDSFLLNRTDDGRIVATLADGMGSGVKANVLSQLTACMSQKFMIADIDIVHAANIIMKTLPVCSQRQVSYSTLTTLNISQDGIVKILEYDNPRLLWWRGDRPLPVERHSASIETTNTRKEIFYSELKLEFGDRLIFFSDGVTQAGMGTKKAPFGWKMENIVTFIQDLLEKEKDISAKNLGKTIVEVAVKYDRYQPKDDITCAVAYYRKSRDTLLITGPPSERSKCPYMVEKFNQFKGKKIVSGGTTSQIIASGIGSDIQVDMKDVKSDVPPRSIMNGAELVTEGLLTINKVINILENEDVKNIVDKDAAYRMVQLLLDSDNIHCLAGTAINAAHQSVDMPVEMGLRRISINKLSKILREKYLKQVTIEYV